MRRPARSGLAVAALIGLAAARGSAQEGVAEPTVTWGAELDTNRRYVWLGQPFSLGPVLQPSLWASRGAFTLNGWASLNLDPGEGSEFRLAELDVILSWAGKLGPISTTVTADAYYWNAPTAKFVNAVLYLRTGVPAGPVEVFAVQLFDLSRYRGSYHLAAGAAWSGRCGSFQCSAQGTLGWASARFNRFYLAVDQPGLLEAATDFSVRWNLGRRLYLRLHLGVSTLVDPELRAALAHPTQVIPGIGIGWQ